MKLKPAWRKVCAAAVIIAVVSAVFALTKPPISALSERISADLAASSNYAERDMNFFFFNLARGKDLRTAEVDAYFGVLGMVIHADAGVGRSLADICAWLPSLAGGARITISLTIISVLAGLLAAVFLALARISKNVVLNKLAGAYIFFFRGTPLLMQLFFIYYGLPAINPAFAINNKFLAAFIAFGLNSAAYCAEIIRAAIESIERGQFEASKALGFSYAQTMRLIIIPQSIRRLIPPVANEFIMVLKDASLVSIIALSDLTHVTRSVSSSEATVLVYVPAMALYLIITAFFTFVFNKLEKRFSIYH